MEIAKGKLGKGGIELSKTALVLRFLSKTKKKERKNASQLLLQSQHKLDVKT